MISTNKSETASAILSDALDGARHPKTKAAFEHIKAGCDYLEEHKIEVSVAEVALLCQRTGPRLQSIHNNKAFKTYIKARRAEQRIGVSPAAREPRFVTEDPEINAIIYALEVEAKRERHQKQNLRQALADGGDYDLDATMRTGRLVRIKSEEPSVGIDISASLRRLLDTDHLRKFGLSIINGRVIAVDRNNREFVEKEDLRILLAASRKEKA
jgi:hypothetical protein